MCRHSATGGRKEKKLFDEIERPKKRTGSNRHEGVSTREEDVEKS